MGIPIYSILEAIVVTVCGAFIGLLLSVFLFWGDDPKFKFTIPVGIIIAWIMFADKQGWIYFY